jgi:hypothetical protein
LSRQSQTSGDGSTQVQANGDVFIGISERRVREIVESSARAVVAEYTHESVQLIQERITKLDDRVIASLIRAGRLEVFSDPGFLRSYAKAQNGAAVSDSDEDYDLLTALLTDRAERGPDRRVRAGIERSIEIVDQIDQESLRGLTVLQAAQQYTAAGPSLDSGLDTLNNLFESLIDGPLPMGADWMDHLDVLDAIRIDQASTLMPFGEYWANQMPGYLATGRLTGDVPWRVTVGGMEQEILGLVIPHELKTGYERLAASNEASLDLAVPWLSPENRADIVVAAKNSLGFGEVDPVLLEPFLERLRLRPALAKIETWWLQIPQVPAVTSVGRVLARANALRLDTNRILPPIQ